MSLCLITSQIFLSWYRPRIRINGNTDLISINDLMFDVNIMIVIGNNSAISKSKTMKITVTRKNRDESSSRAELFGSNPHQMKFFFSVFVDSFLD
jgi:hypothetical protein